MFLINVFSSVLYIYDIHNVVNQCLFFLKKKHYGLVIYINNNIDITNQCLL